MLKLNEQQIALLAEIIEDQKDMVIQQELHLEEEQDLLSEFESINSKEALLARLIKHDVDSEYLHRLDEVYLLAPDKESDEKINKATIA